MKKVALAIAILLGGSASFGAAMSSNLDNTVVVAQDERTEISKDELPEAVSDAWDSGEYSDYQISAVYQVRSTDELGNSVITYEIEYTNEEGTIGTVTFDENGEMIG